MNSDRKGVSPVVGTVLLVAITVVIAGVLAYTVWGIGTPEIAPTASLKIEDGSAEKRFVLQHQGGDDLVGNNIEWGSASGKDSKIDGYATVGENLEADDFKENRTPDNGTGWYHVVIRHDPSDTILLDANIEVR